MAYGIKTKGSKLKAQSSKQILKNTLSALRLIIDGIWS